MIDRYVADSNRPGFERVPELEWVCKSNRWETPADVARDREWTANMLAGFPRKWQHVQNPDRRWSWAWADELAVAT